MRAASTLHSATAAALHATLCKRLTAQRLEIQVTSQAQVIIQELSLQRSAL
jgi:hypothetical protein